MTQHKDTPRFAKFLRKVETPYWAARPRTWRSASGGFGSFADEGDAGLFNLAWLTAATKKPTANTQYRQPYVMQLIQSGQYIVLANGFTLAYNASMMIPPELSDMIGETQYRRDESAFLGVTLVLLDNVIDKELWSDYAIDG